MQRLLFENQNCCRDGRGPQAALVAHGRLCHVTGADDLVGDAVDLLLRPSSLVGIEI